MLFMFVVDMDILSWFLYAICIPISNQYSSRLQDYLPLILDRRAGEQDWGRQRGQAGHQDLQDRERRTEEQG